MIYWCLLNGYILISLVQQGQGQTTLNVANAICSQTYIDYGLKTVYCQKNKSAPSRLSRIAINSIPHDVQVIFLTELYDFTIEPNFLSDHFYDLKKIIMQRVYLVDNSPNLEKAQEWHRNMLKMFYANMKMIDIKMYFCHLKDADNFTFPSTIRILDLSNNDYHVIDVRGYEELEIVEVESNKLESLPRFSNPAPSIRRLNLNDNPLNNLTVNDLAPLCGLTSLEMTLYMESFLRKRAGICECNRIKNWTKEVNIKLIGLICDDEEHNGTADCSDYTLDEARKIRKKCFTLETGHSLIFRIVTRYSYRILSVFMLLIVVIVLVYTIYKMYASSRARKTESRGKRRNFSSYIHEESEYQD